MTTCFLTGPHEHKEEAEKVLSQVRTVSFRLILKELIKEYGVIIIFIIIIISGSYLWLWNRHRPVAMGTDRNVQIILSCAMMVSWIT